MVYISWILFALMGSLGIYIEQASSQRLIWLLGPFLAGLSLMMAAQYLSHQKNMTPSRSQRLMVLLKLLGIGCIILMEAHSKYSINDLLNWLYLPLLISGYSHLSKKGLLTLLLLSLAAMSGKYAYMAMVDPTVIRVPALMANLGVLLLMGIILYLSRQLAEEKERLLTANCELIQMSREIEGLTVYRERQYIAREIHDTVGHSLTALVMKLEMSRVYAKSPSQEEVEKSKVMIAEAIDEGRLALKNTREVVETMNRPRRSPQELVALIEKSSKLNGLQTLIQGEDLLNSLDDLQSHAVYRAVQEALTNCLKYSSADHFRVSFSKATQSINVEITDNGSPTEAQKKHAFDLINDKEGSGMGLKSMSARVLRSGGRFDLNYDTGFTIKMSFDTEEVKP